MQAWQLVKHMRWLLEVAAEARHSAAQTRTNSRATVIESRMTINAVREMRARRLTAKKQREMEAHLRASAAKEDDPS